MKFLCGTGRATHLQATRIDRFFQKNIPMKRIFSLLILAAFLSTGFAYHYGLTVAVSSKSAAPGATICLDVTTRDFNNIVAAQYSMKWDPAVLKFKSVKNFGLPALNEQNFGVQSTDKGVLTFLWYDPSVRGVQFPNNGILYNVCYDVVGQSGDKTYFRFVDKPTTIEVGDASGAVLPLNAVPGTIRVK